MRYLLFALSYYTRIPAPRLKEYRPDDATHALRWFSFIGIVVGLVSALAWFVFARFLGLGQQICAILALAVGVLATGAFHEDGFADMADGFGGGYTREKILSIMKDSRIGSYGVIGLIFLFAAKFVLLSEVLREQSLASMLFIIAYHAAARATAGCMVFCSSYARNDGTAKVAMDNRAWNWKEVALLLLFGLLPLVACSVIFTPLLMGAIVPLAILLAWFRHYCHKHIGGYTGDCLGALEQLAEVVTLLWFSFILH